MCLDFAAVVVALLWAVSPSFFSLTKVATTSTSLPITSLSSACLTFLPLRSPHPPQCLADWVLQSCQSLAGPAKLYILARGETRANGRGVVAGPSNLPPLSSGPPQQIEPPAGRHRAHHCPMLRAHMPRSTNSHLHMNMHSYTNMCMYGYTCLPAQTSANKHTNTVCGVLTHSLKSFQVLWKNQQIFLKCFFNSLVEKLWLFENNLGYDHYWGWLNLCQFLISNWREHCLIV